MAERDSHKTTKQEALLFLLTGPRSRRQATRKQGSAWARTWAKSQQAAALVLRLRVY